MTFFVIFAHNFSTFFLQFLTILSIWSNKKTLICSSFCDQVKFFDIYYNLRILPKTFFTLFLTITSFGQSQRHPWILVTFDNSSHFRPFPDHFETIACRFQFADHFIPFPVHSTPIFTLDRPCAFNQRPFSRLARDYLPTISSNKRPFFRHPRHIFTTSKTVTGHFSTICSTFPRHFRPIPGHFPEISRPHSYPQAIRKGISFGPTQDHFSPSISRFRPFPRHLRPFQVVS